MSNNSLFQILTPKDKKFYPLFEKVAANIEEAAHALCQALNVKDIIDRNALYIRQIDKIEKKGDEMTEEIFTTLDNSFITPFDREDIHSLATAFDDILDLIHGSAKRLELYDIKTTNPNFIKLGEYILSGCKDLHSIMKYFGEPSSNASKIIHTCMNIDKLEKAADEVYNTAVAKLFKEETNAIELIKTKDILAILETVTDKSEDTANIIKSIILKAS